ncbi:MAG: FHA domain-containing protein [Bdellovibrionaceae bacterium]|nr:FHA domain-containing protein [Pseudobdellovibrionaceae bacterium]
MTRLRVRLQGKVIQEVPLSEERSYLAGRHEDCDVRLQNEKGISREHFRISFVEGQWQLEVVSRFGDVIADGEKVQNLNLSEKGSFFLPPYEFEFSEASGALVAAKRGDAPALFQGSEGDGGDTNERTFVGATNTVPYVKVIDSSGETKEMFKLEGGNTWVAGRDSACDIIIRDQRVSRRQFEIRFENNQYFILDLGSVNGTLINGSPVSSAEATAIKSSDAISVLDNHLYFELHDPNFKARLELVKATAPNPLVQLSPDMLPSAVQQYQQNSMQQYSPQMQGSMNGYDQFQEAPDKKFDFEKHRVKIIVAAVALLAVAYLFSGSGGGGPAPASVGTVGMGSKSMEAFNKLPAEKQIFVKQTYQLAKNLYMQQKFELARAEIVKMYEYVPEYEDSKDIERLANEAIEIIAQQRSNDDKEKAKAETGEKIQAQVKECKSKINRDYTVASLEECLSPILQFNPEHPAILELRTSVDQIVANKQAKDMQKQEYQSQVQRLKGLYGRAESSQREAQYLKAIKEFQTVANSSLPDPNALKQHARRQIASLQGTLRVKTDQYEKDAEQAYKDQKLKDAVVSLRKSLDVDPNNEAAKEKIEHYKSELKKQMMVLYQEGVLEESYGNVDGGENRPGAKDKWKKIMELDVTDGDYYAKAKIKLKKYGAL